MTLPKQLALQGKQLDYTYNDNSLDIRGLCSTFGAQELPTPHRISVSLFMAVLACYVGAVRLRPSPEATGTTSA